MAGKLQNSDHKTLTELQNLGAGKTQLINTDKAYTPKSDKVLEDTLRKNNYSATTDPTTSNDISQNYEVGSEWVNTNTGAIFTCVDNTAGAALWPESGAGANVRNEETVTVTGNFTINSSLNDFTVNVNTATATITLPTGSPIGTRRLVRKTNSTQGTVTITSAGSEVFTRAGVLNIALNANGDYWLLEKATSFRWDLLEGFETGSNSNGDYFRYADGTQRCSLFRLDTKKNTSWEFIGGLYDSNFDKTWTYPKPFESNVIGETILSDSAGSNSAIFAVKINRPNGTVSITYEYWSSVDFGNTDNSNDVNGNGLNIGISLKATGLWY